MTSVRSSRFARTGGGALTRAAVAGALLTTILAMAPAGPGASDGNFRSRTVTQRERATMAKTSTDQLEREARPMRIPESSETGGDGQEQGVAGAAGAAGEAGQATAAKQTTNTIGKLYFDEKPGPGEKWSHCSATVINTESKSLVVTAGHCVYDPDPDNNRIIDGNGYFFENFKFCPGYAQGCKLGTWEYRQVATTNSWAYGFGNTRAYDFRDDFAVITFNPNGQGKLVDAVGGQGISFNGATGASRVSYGYPAPDSRFPEYRYTGEDLIYCAGQDTYDTAIPGTLRLPCTMTGGASGGPWIVNGYVTSVNSHKVDGKTMNGPYFDAPESTLFQAWRNR